MTFPSPASMPLAGVRVVEFCHVAAGPFCAMLLADYGAEVIKLEPLEGDGLREWPPHSDGYSENFASLNRGKQSMALDLKREAHRDQARRLMLDADVIVENNRPGVMQRLGLGWDWIGPLRPDLIYCSISAFGQDGPRAAEGGFDLTIQAAAGVMSVTGEADGAPVKCGVPIADFTAGLYAAFTIAALVSRVRAGGPGGHVDVPMFAATLAVSALQTSQFFGTGTDPGKLGSAHPRNAPYQAYPARDGWFAIAAGNNKLWMSVCDVVAIDGLADDARFKTTGGRALHQGALAQALEQRFREAPVSHWLARFGEAGVPCAPINSYSHALDDMQASHLGLVRPMTLPNGHVTRTVGCPVRLDGRPVEVDTRPPALGGAPQAQFSPRPVKRTDASRR